MVERLHDSRVVAAGVEALLEDVLADKKRRAVGASSAGGREAMTELPGELDLSIIIVSYRTRDLLRRCLESVKNNTSCRFEVIVVDNDSDDGSAEMVAKRISRCHSSPE